MGEDCGKNRFHTHNDRRRRGRASLLADHLQRKGDPDRQDPGIGDGARSCLYLVKGAVPKDGPSAGVAMLTCLVSLMTGRRVKKRLAMSGEITLRGEVLPVGGIKEKVIAAHRTGIREIILPLWNKKDMEDIPGYIKDSIEFHFIDKMKNVLELALE